MIQPFQYAYLGESLIRPTANVARFIAPSDGTISELFINAIFAPFKDTTFNLKINGISKFSGAARPVILSGTNSISKTGLSFAVVKGDVISFDAEIVQQGGVSAPVFFQVNFADEQEFTSEADVVALIGENIIAGDNVTIDEADGVLTINAENGTTTEEIQDIINSTLVAGSNVTLSYNDGANTLTIDAATRTNEEIQDVVGAMLVAGSNVTLNYNDTANTLTISASGGGSSNSFSYFDPDVPYASPSAFDDEFTTSTLNAKWSTRGTPTLTHEQPYSYTRFVGTLGINGVYQAYSSASGSAIFRMKVTPIGLASGNDNQGGGIYFKKATTAFGIEFVKTNEYFTLAATFWTNVTTFNSNQATHASIRIPSGTPVWLELDFNFTNGNVTYRYSFDGINFGLFFNDVSNASGTVEVGIKAPSNASNSALKVDWFRKVDGTGFTGKKVDL